MPDNIELLPPSPESAPTLKYVDVRTKINEGINRLNLGLASYVVAGRGGIGIDAPSVIGTVNATPVVLTGFDTEILTDTRFVTQLPLTNNGIAFDKAGVWDIAIKCSLEFDTSNVGRRIALQFYNANTGLIGADTFRFYVGRDQEGVNLTITTPFAIPEEVIGDVVQLRVFSEAHTLTNVTNIGTTYTAIRVSEG